MRKYDYIGLRGKLYDAVSTLGNAAEGSNDFHLNEAYERASEMLDMIDEYGVDNGILEADSLALINDVTEKKGS